MKKNLIDILNNFVKVRDISYVQRGTGILSLSQTALEAESRCFETSDVVDTLIATTLGIYILNRPPFEGGNARAAVFWRQRIAASS